jgi:hypothetical protein
MQSGERPRQSCSDDDADALEFIVEPHRFGEPHVAAPTALRQSKTLIEAEQIHKVRLHTDVFVGLFLQQ